MENKEKPLRTINMKKLLLILFFTIVTASSSFAKRTSPPELESINYKGLEYNIDYYFSRFSEEALITVTDNTDSEFISVKLITLYKKFFIPFLETDVQWVFIKKMELTGNNTIRFYREDEQIFELNLNDNSIKKITQSKNWSSITVRLILIFIVILMGYILYRLIRGELEIRKKMAEKRMKELSMTNGAESLYKNDREFKQKMLNRNLIIIGIVFVFLVISFIIMLIIRLLNR